MQRALLLYNVTHFMFPSKVCQLLCHLHAISIGMPTGPEVTRSGEPNMLVDRITAHIQRRDECTHWRDSLIGQGILYWVSPEEDSLYNLHVYGLYGLQLSLDFIFVPKKAERKANPACIN